MLTAGFDPLRDEGLDYADRLVAAGNQATYVCFERQIHGFITMGKVIDEANSAVALVRRRAGARARSLSARERTERRGAPERAAASSAAKRRAQLADEAGLTAALALCAPA